MKIKYTKTCTTVYDCYKYSSKEIDLLGDVIISERKLRELPVTRTPKSYASEIKAHKRAYKLGIMRSHTKDADLEESISKNKEILYRIIGV